MPPDDAMSRAASRRVEVFSGSSRRRWSREEKAQIVAESYGTESACAVARRYGLAQTQIFTWRRDLRRPVEGPVSPAFVSVVVEAAPEPVSPARAKRPRRVKATGEIELEIAGVTVRIGRGADQRTLETVLRALKADH